LAQEGEVYVLAQSQARAGKERGMRRRSLKDYWKRLGELAERDLKRDLLLEKLGAAKQKAGRIASALVEVSVSAEGKLSFRLDRDKLRKTFRREGSYLLRTNLDEKQPELIWQSYMQLCHVEEAFRTLKGDLGLRPIYHQKPERIEAHLFVSFLSFCLTTTLRQQLRGMAGGLMPRTIYEKFATIQMIDDRIPTTEGRELLLVRHTLPSNVVSLLLNQLKLSLPPQPPPQINKINSSHVVATFS
jgi:transposase